ncbi:MAG: hypothetical protein IPH07_21175 [Deltaproteobacteria bacterium]|nr:hypothetical protein [Deltaproteobacteria bacterium]MBK8239794.1 hypothetical protein [Deltaproteobacteria bacterium]MBK8714530.1 hypothetical protein [Deltaproteobacteria bacterium]MBP7288283.1 hypothetical protein [Nannocystaceae bacterium]
MITPPHRFAVLAPLLAALGACSTPAQDQVEAHRDAEQELRDATSKTQAELDQANRKLAAELREAKGPKEIAAAIDRHDATVVDAHEELAASVSKQAEKLAEADHDAAAAIAGAVAFAPFERDEGESLAAFCSRAEQRIVALEADLGGLNAQAVGSSSTDARTQLSKATTSLAEARKDLDEVRYGDAAILDDGRLGVGIAINRAQHQLTAARQALVAGARM